MRASLVKEPAVPAEDPPGHHLAPTPGKPHVQERVLGPTPTPPEPPGGGYGEAGGRPKRRRLPRVVIALAVLCVLLGVALTVHLNYDVFVPGEAPDAGSLVQINGQGVHKRAGSIHLTTVGVYYGVRLPQLIGAWFDKTSQIVSEAQYPNVPGQEVIAMDQSQRDAKIAALGDLFGYQNLPTKGVLIVNLLSNAPAAKVLQPGDVITEVDGTPVTAPDQLETGVQKHSLGQSVHLKVQRSGKSMDVDVATITNAQPSPAKIIGVGVEPDYEPTIDIKINAGDIGGPSAGLSWALAIENLLGPNDLTRGRTIADTGTIDYRGNVGEIGGMPQKVFGAEKVGATLFIVPKTQAAEAMAAVAQSHSRMKVVGVSTLHEAVDALNAA